MKNNEPKRTKKKLSETQLKSEILSFLNSVNGSKTNFYELKRTKFHLAKQKTLKIFTQVQSEWVKIKEQAQNEAMVESTKEAIKSGLKSKIERQLHLQKLIDDIQKDIDRGILEKYIVVDRKVQVVNAVMNAETKARLADTIKGLHAELSKMEGDYAPTKLEHDAKIKGTYNILFNEVLNEDEITEQAT
jgi:hypothetical protein